MFYPRENRTVEHGQLVQVYRNLHNGFFSIRDKKTQLVLGYSHFIVLDNVTFRVQNGARARVKKTGSRNVHAFAEGTLRHCQKVVDDKRKREISYDPFATNDFYFVDTKEEVVSVPVLSCRNEKVYTI